MRDAASAQRFFARELIGRGTEAVRVAHLDGDGHLLGISASDSDAYGAIALPIRAIARDVIAFGTIGLILAHNHPSGDPTPSAADIAVTRELVAVMRGLGVQVLDHLIIAGSGWQSFRALGLL